MEPNRDFKELLERFNAHRVEYLIVGGYALAVHGVPRYTQDLDLYVRPSPENAKRILSLLDEFGYGKLGCTVEEFTRPDTILQLGTPPVRVDLITGIGGVSWEQAEAGRLSGEYGDVPVFFLGRVEFIANKRAVGRAKDMADLEALGEGNAKPGNPQG